MHLHRNKRKSHYKHAGNEHRERYWYNRALREAQAKEEAENNAEATTTPNG